MNLFKPPSPEPLAEWLEITTGKLSSPAKERLRLEIEAHYAQAIQAQQVLGLSDADAARAALAQLGDPHVAAKRFRAQHLTTAEVKSFGVLQKWGGSVPNLLLQYSVFFILLYNVRPLYPEIFGTVRILAAFVLLIVWPTYAIFKARWSRNRATMGTWQRFLVILYMQSVPVFILLLVLSRYSRSNPAAIDSWIMLLPLSVVLTCMLYLANRLRQFGEIWNDAPPKATAT